MGSDVGAGISAAHDIGVRIVGQLERVILGKHQVLRLAVASVLAGGHVLFEDGPGVGKTTLAKAMAASLGLDANRVQGTPDLLPSDITGLSVFDLTRSMWEYRAGPIFAGVVLFDEINRATPRCQSALFEAMAEGQVTVEGVTRPLPSPFLLLATQNPSSDTGTFPLGRTQRDRFAVGLSIGLPAPDVERRVVAGEGGPERILELGSVADAESLRAAQIAVRGLHVAPTLVDYAVTLVEATRPHTEGSGTPSPRAGIALIGLARAVAVLAGRDHARPEDVQVVAPWVLAHRSFPDMALSAAVDRVLSIVNTVPVRP